MGQDKSRDARFVEKGTEWQKFIDVSKPEAEIGSAQKEESIDRLLEQFSNDQEENEQQ